MVSFGTLVYTFFSRLLLLLLMMVTAIPMVILVFVVPQKYRYNRVYFFLSGILYKAIMRLSLLPITIIGEQHILNTPSIFVANHSSSLDIPMLGMLLKGKPHIWLAMKWLTNFWFFHLVLPRTAILVDMSMPYSGVRSLIKTIQMAKDHAMNIMIFPEGKRYTDGNVHDFYGGFALLARKTEFPIIPVRIFNLQKVYPPNTFWVHYHSIKVVIGKPMYIQERESEEEFKQRVHQWFIKQGGL